MEDTEDNAESLRYRSSAPIAAVGSVLSEVLVSPITSAALVAAVPVAAVRDAGAREEPDGCVAVTVLGQKQTACGCCLPSFSRGREMSCGTSGLEIVLSPFRNLSEFSAQVSRYE
jgi:hypothetical protein